MAGTFDAQPMGPLRTPNKTSHPKLWIPACAGMTGFC